MSKSKTFDSYWYEIEAFATRSDRFYQNLLDITNSDIEKTNELYQMCLKWLEAAYDIGKEDSR